MEQELNQQPKLQVLKWQAEIRGQWAEALASAQDEFKDIKKSAKATIRMKSGGQYEYKYATLDSIRAATQKALSKHGLACTQVFQHGCIVTKLTHKGGHQESSFLPIKTDQEKPQELGSLITYMRRYAIGAMLGVATVEDDDGNAAQGNEPATQGSGKGQGSKGGAKAKKPPYKRTKPISLSQKMGLIQSFIKKDCDWSMDDAQTFMEKLTGKADSSQLDEEEIKTIMQTMKDTDFKNALLICPTN